MVRYDKSSAAKGGRYVRDQRGRRRVGRPVAAGGGIVGLVVALIIALSGLDGSG